jgi:hypothetical protein
MRPMYLNVLLMLVALVVLVVISALLASRLD